jgi:aryl-alcohol dehydrogenase-like predicted oxidoreductase
MTDFRLAGIDVPRIGLGTNRLTTASRHVTFVREAVAAGVRHIDTAHLYRGGDSERAIGEALDGTSEDVLIATKGGYGGAGQGRPEVLRAQIEQSLRSLRTEAIGLYYLHRVDPETPLEESLGAIKAYVDRGAIRHVGVSEVSVEQIEQARQLVPIAAVQNRYNLADRRHDDVVDFCAREGIAFVPYYPLSGYEAPRVAAAAKRLGVTENTVKLCARTSRHSSSSWTTRTTSPPEASGSTPAALIQRKDGIYIEISLGESERLFDAQPGSPEDHDQAAQPPAVRLSPAAPMTPMISSTLGGSAGYVALGR